MEMDVNETRPTVSVEIQQSKTSLQKEYQVISAVEKYLQFLGSDIPKTLMTHFDDGYLCSNLISLRLCLLEATLDNECFDINNANFVYYVYRLDYSGPGTEDIGGGEEEEVPAATQWTLPSANFDGLWESLIYDSEIKDQLLNFVKTALLFSDRKVDPNVITWNKVVLLHGPPGTGKTSLCQALAHKLSIRMNDRYRTSQLVEVNSHSLFSKWFSESGKLVQKMFARVTELLDDPSCLVFVLIDEVESLTRGRESSSSGCEPSDALRVVNAFLTQLDQIKRYPNVLILTTSNISGAIDLAFVDRADIKQYIGLPTQDAIYHIYLSCINELMKKKIINSNVPLLDLRSVRLFNKEKEHNAINNDRYSKSTLMEETLLKLAQNSVGLSGRTLRKIPFLAHALSVHSGSATLSQFLSAMAHAIHKQKTERQQLGVDCLAASNPLNIDNSMSMKSNGQQ